MENWAERIEQDMRTVTTTLEFVHNGAQQVRLLAAATAELRRRAPLAHHRGCCLRAVVARVAQLQIAIPLF